MPLIKYICVIFIEFIRGVPLITLLFVASVMLSYFFPPEATVDLFLRVVIMITMFSAAYIAEVIQGGLAALPKGQYEAADSLGLDYAQAMRLIILPQALKISIPGIVNVAVGLFKDTTLVSVISMFDIVGMIRVMGGVIRKGDRIKMMQTGATYGIDKLAVLKPQMVDIPELGPGEIGILTASIKQVRDTKVGDTITHEKKGTDTPLPGFAPSVPVVFCGLFPVDSAEFEDLRNAIEKLALNDASFSNEMETSAALGFGFRCGFLGLLHLEVIRDRIEREYDIDLITTAPSVIYHVYMRDGSMIELHNPADMPDLTHVDHLEEPRIKATILVPDEYLGDVLKLCQDRRGIQMDLTCRQPRHGRL